MHDVNFFQTWGSFRFEKQNGKNREKVWKKVMGFGEEGKNLSSKGFSLFPKTAESAFTE